MSEHLTISVVVPSYQRPLDLQRCLAAIGRQTQLPEEVLVVARREDAETSATVSSTDFGLKNLHLRYVGQPGLVAAMNQGLEHATGDLLVFTDDDAEAEADWLERVEKSFVDRRIGAVGGRDWIQLPREPALYRPKEVSQVGILTWYGKALGNHHCPVRRHTLEVMYLKGVNMAIRRSALGAGRVDTRLRGRGSQVGTELDLCMQIRAAGFLILFDDRILVKHHSSPRSEADDRSDRTGTVTRDMSFNTHYLTAKHFGRVRSFTHLLNTLAFGGRSQPGLLAALKWRIKGDRFAFQRFWSTVEMASAGFYAGRGLQKTSPAKRSDWKWSCSPGA